jgi:hypothetical protein
MAKEGMKQWATGELAALSGGGMVGNVTAAGTLAEAGTTAKTVAQEVETGANSASSDETAAVAQAAKTPEITGKAQWYNADGSINYPPNGGRILGTEVNRTLETGEVLGRYGGVGPKSNYVTESGVDPSTLSLPPTTDPSKYQEFIVVKPIPGVIQSKVAAWGGDPGGGLQYELPMTINELLRLGYIKEKI